MITSDNLKYYINTNLQGIVSVNGVNEVHIMIGLDKFNVYTNRSSKPIPILNFKPIMRKLDDILELSINENNNHVIPIFEVAKISDKIGFKQSKYLKKVIMDDDSLDYGKTLYACGWENIDNNEYKMFFSLENNSFYIARMGIKDVPKIVPNQFLLFKILYGWHFWLGDQNYFNENIVIDIKSL